MLLGGGRQRKRDDLALPHGIAGLVAVGAFIANGIGLPPGIGSGLCHAIAALALARFAFSALARFAFARLGHLADFARLGHFAVLAGLALLRLQRGCSGQAQRGKHREPCHTADPLLVHSLPLSPPLACDNASPPLVFPGRERVA